MSFQRKQRHFTDINFPRGKHRPHCFCQQFLAVYAMLSHYLICGEFYINHKEKTESIMLLRMDAALLIFPALYQHWWIKPPMVPVRPKHRVILFDSGTETEIGSQVSCLLLCGEWGSGPAWGENWCVEARGPHLPPPAVFREPQVLKLGRPVVWGSVENVCSSQISINQHTLIFFNYLHRTDLILKSLCDLKNVSPICQTCIIYEGPSSPDL